ncbi:MAG: hypothetical protein H6813_01950 [Phycisphaeraceae bacterium]|nr:hypothetical protein [Phycisphaeraceae bacterium]
MDILRAAAQVGSRSVPIQQALARAGVRGLRRTFTRLAAFFWALTMTVGGGLMVCSASDTAAWLQPTLLGAGFTGIVSGLFIFQVLVVDRLLPITDPRLVRNVEASMGVALMIGVAITTLTLLT